MPLMTKRRAAPISRPSKEFCVHLKDHTIGYLLLDALDDHAACRADVAVRTGHYKRRIPFRRGLRAYIVFFLERIREENMCVVLIYETDTACIREEKKRFTDVAVRRGHYQRRVAFRRGLLTYIVSF
jgi:hypothetical protein